MNELIYVGSPYSHPDYWIRNARYKAVMDYCVFLIRQGKFAYSPIVYGHEMAREHFLPTDAKWWEDFNHTFLARCDALHVYHMDGWEDSKGLAAEIEFAETHGITSVHMDALCEPKKEKRNASSQ